MTSMTLDYHGPSDMCRPFIWTLPLARRTFLFTDIKPSDVHGRKEAFRLISDAAQRADNVGTDEVPSVDYLDWLMGYTDAVIAISDVSTASDTAMIGLIIIHQCAYVRSYHASSFNLIVVTGETISSRLVWRDLARLGFEIGTRGERRYTACAINVFVTCYELVAALREEGFVITACIPEAGLVNGFPGRHIDSYVMYKELNCLPKPLLLTPSSEFSEDNDDAISDDVKLLNLHFLPVRYVLTDGTPIVIRGLRDQDEIRSFYTAFKDAATSGSGYGIDEFPSFGYFVRWYVSDFYNLVFELAPDGSHDAPSSSHATGGKTVAYANFGRSLLSRSVNNPLLSDGNVVLLPEFRGRRWSSELQRIQFGISYDAGLRRIMGETSTKNIPELLSMRRLGVIVTGSLPRGVYLKDCGWLDLVTLYREINESFLNDMLQPQLSGRLQQLTSKI